jgi:hypothetical protein
MVGLENWSALVLVRLWVDGLIFRLSGVELGMISLMSRCSVVLVPSSQILCFLICFVVLTVQHLVVE